MIDDEIFDNKLEPLPSYQTLDHPADVMFRANGDSLASCFRSITRAMSDLVTLESKIERNFYCDIELDATTIAQLVYEFVDLFIVCSSSEPNFIIYDLINTSICESNGKNVLSCRVIGDFFDPEKYKFGTEAKAPSLHLLK